jgi:DNA-directed RNA polymerase subunit F
MDNIFRERRLVCFGAENVRNYEDQESADAVAGGLERRDFKDTKAGQDIDNRLLSLRNDIMKCDLLKQDEQQEWQRRIIDARQKNLTEQEVEKLESEFADQYGDIKNLVTNYTEKVMDHRETAFAYDPGKNVDVAQEYVEWFNKQDRLEQQRAWEKLDDEIVEREDLRDKILKIRPDLEDKVKTLDRTNRKKLIGELEQCDANCKVYEGMLELNKDYFHDVEMYKKEFADQTLQEQKRWIRLFPQVIAERKELVDEFRDLPKEFQEDKFYALPSTKKKEYLKKLEKDLVKDFDREVDRIESTTWSKDSKEFTKKTFRDIPTLKIKAEFLIKLKNGEITKEDAKLTEQYKKYSKELRNIDGYTIKEWENSPIKDKKEMLKKMEAEEKMLTAFTTITDKERDNQVISKKTHKRYRDRYVSFNISQRSIELREIVFAMAERRKLMNQFEKLEPEAQTKFKDSFYPRGHRARLQAYSEASLMNQKLKAKKDAEKAGEKAEQKATKGKLEKTPEKASAESANKLEAKDVQAVVKDYHNLADAYEDQGKLEKAVTMHEAVLRLDPQNALSIKRKKELDIKIEASEMWKDEKVFEALESASTSASLQEEMFNLNLIEQLFRDQEKWIHESSGAEDITKRKRNRTDDFEQQVHERITENTSGAYIVDDDGKMREVMFVDVGKLGNRREDVFKLQEKLRYKKQNEHLTDVTFQDEMTGKHTTITETHQRIDKRKDEAAKELLKRTRGRGKLKQKEGMPTEKTDKDIRETAKKVIEKKMASKKLTS